MGSINISSVKSEFVTANTKKGSINIKDSVRAGTLSLSSKSGNIDSIAEFSHLNCKTTIGSIYLIIYAKNEVDVNAFSIEGNIDVKLLRKYDMISALESGVGQVDNNYNLKDGDYSLYLSIFTKLGTITIDDLSKYKMCN